jgi:hypothetical protein
MIEKAPDFVEPYALKGFCRWFEKDLTGAIDYLGRALDRKESPELAIALAVMLKHLGKGAGAEFANLERLLTRALQLSPYELAGYDLLISEYKEHFRFLRAYETWRVLSSVEDRLFP